MFFLMRYPFAFKAIISKRVMQYYSNSLRKSHKSVYDVVKEGGPVETFDLRQRYDLDEDPKKVNLGIGVYRTEDGEPFTLPVVKKVELEIAQDTRLNHDYLPVLGSSEFTKAATEVLLGKDSPAIKECRIANAQTLSGTGALRIASEFLCHHMKKRTCYLPVPTYKNHHGILRMSGFKQIKTLPYYDAKKHKIDFARLLAALCKVPEGAVVLLQASGHNPTGMDLNKRQWKQIAEMMKLRQLFPFFDVAYQGFTSGDLDRDSWGLRHFIKEGFETMIAQSFSKNMGLYNVRIGNLIVVTNNPGLCPAIASQLTNLVKVNYVSPPAHGSNIVTRILSDEENRAEWCKSMQQMSGRVKKMRVALVDKLRELETPGKWEHIVQGRGMFSLLGLSPEQCEKLTADKHIYLMKTSRVNMCGLNGNNIDYVAESINEVVRETGGQYPDRESVGSVGDASSSDKDEYECEI